MPFWPLFMQPFWPLFMQLRPRIIIALLLGLCAACFCPCGCYTNSGIYPKDRTYRAFFVQFNKRNFYSDGPKGFECIFDSSCMQLRPRLKVLGLIIATKSVDKLSIAKSYKNSATIVFAIQWNFHLTDKIADFLRNKHFFLIVPRDFHYYWASAHNCAACFCLCGC